MPLAPRIAIPAALPAGTGRHPPQGVVVTLGGLSMGTCWSARLVSAAPERAPLLQAGLVQVLAGVVAAMSHWEPASDLSRFNRAPVGAWVDLPPALLGVLAAGLEIAARSDGAFDPAIGSLVDHWGFGPPGAAGSSAPIARAMGGAWRAIALRGGQARRTADVRLDLSGIAKGHAVDAMAAWLGTQGVDDFLVEAGGELRGEGGKPDGQPWWVVLEPVPGLAVPPTRVALCGLSVATSGDYRKFREVGDRRDSHSIDPASGEPVRNAVASVTVLHREAMRADAWATAFMVMGPQAAMRTAMVEKLAVVMIERSGAGGREYQSPAFAAMLA